MSKHIMSPYYEPIKCICVKLVMLAAKMSAAFALEVNLTECISCMSQSVNKATHSGFKPTGDTTRSPKHGYQWPEEKDLCSPEKNCDCRGGGLNTGLFTPLPCQRNFQVQRPLAATTSKLMDLELNVLFGLIWVFWAYCWCFGTGLQWTHPLMP